MIVTSYLKSKVYCIHLIYEIQEYYQVEAIVGGWEHTKKKKVIGFNILMPNSKIVVEEMNRILNDKLSTIKRE